MTHTKQTRLLAIAPSSRGFGFVIFEGDKELIDWGNKTVNSGDKNSQCLAKLEKLMNAYQPTMLVMQATKDSNRAARIKKLCRQIVARAKTRKLKVKLLSYRQVNDFFHPNAANTKYERAEFIAAQFPETLGVNLPPKRRAWTSEDGRMDIFEAAALVLSEQNHRLKHVTKNIKISLDQI